MGNAHSSKADRKAAAAAAGDKGTRGTYEDTAFGRRRISRFPKAMMTLIGLIGVPVWFIYRRLRRSSAR